MVTIANGSSFTLHIKVENENKIKENHSESRLEFSVPYFKANFSSNPKANNKEEILLEPGYSVLPRSEATSFGISSKKRKFVSIFYEDAKGKHVVIHDKKEVLGDSSWIVTPSGGLIESDPEDPWIGKLDQKSYKFVCCDEKCELCILRTSQMCLEDIKVLNVGDRLTKMAATVKRKNAIKSTAKKQLQEAAKQYREFEQSNRSATSNIKRYGKNLEDAADDFENDENIGDFLRERAMTRTVKSSLENTVLKFNQFLSIWDVTFPYFESNFGLGMLVAEKENCESFDCIVSSTHKVQEKVQIIRTCLEDIEEKYADLYSAVEKVKRYKGNLEKVKKMVSRAKTNAIALVTACENYMREVS
jgi:hypothetical protein